MIKDMNNRAEQIIDGALLSDASLKYTGASAMFSIAQAGTSHTDWLAIIKESLISMGISVSDRYPKVYLKGSGHVDTYLYSSSCVELIPLYHKWYRGGEVRRRTYHSSTRARMVNSLCVGATKIIPSDLEITPITLAHWFMGDGGSSIMHETHILASFSTCSFTISEVEGLIEKIKLLGVDTYLGNNNGHPVLQLGSDSDIFNLMRVIEPYMVPSMMYKIKYPERILETRSR